MFFSFFPLLPPPPPFLPLSLSFSLKNQSIEKNVKGNSSPNCYTPKCLRYTTLLPTLRDDREQTSTVATLRISYLWGPGVGVKESHVCPSTPDSGGPTNSQTAGIVGSKAAAATPKAAPESVHQLIPVPWTNINPLSVRPPKSPSHQRWEPTNAVCSLASQFWGALLM